MISKLRQVAFIALLVTFTGAHAFTYSEHDGTAEDAIGITGGGNFAWMMGFQVTGGKSVISSIGVAFGLPGSSSGVTTGDPFNVYVWSATNGTWGSPTLLAQATAFADGGSIATNVLQTVPIHAVVPGGDGAWFFIGASINHAAGTFPAALDQSAPVSNTAWAAGVSTPGGFDPNNLSAGIGLHRLSNLGFSGDWLLEAKAGAIPGPAPMIPFLAGFAANMLRRRRSKGAAKSQGGGTGHGARSRTARLIGN